MIHDHFYESQEDALKIAWDANTDHEEHLARWAQELLETAGACPIQHMFKAGTS